MSSLGYVVGLGLWCIFLCLPTRDDARPLSTKPTRTGTGSRQSMARDQNALPKGALSRLGTLRFRHGDHVKCIAYSPDGTKFVSGGGADDPTISVWDVKTGKELKRLEAHKNCITALAFSSDGKLVGVKSGDGGPTQLPRST